MNLLSNEIQKFNEKDLSILEENQFKYRAVCNSLIKSLKIKNSEEAIELLSNSQRVADDLQRELKYSNNFSLKIIIREWNNNLPYEMEFRGFVYKNKLTAISQYDSYLFSKELNLKKKEIEKKINTFFNEMIKEKLKKFENYIIDFGILNDGNIVVIELNPFNNEFVSLKKNLNLIFFFWTQEQRNRWLFILLECW